MFTRKTASNCLGAPARARPTALLVPQRMAYPSPQHATRQLHASIAAAAQEASSSNHAVFPSVARLLAEHADVDVSKIRGTGVRGMLTKGDVLAHLGEVGSPLGSAKGKDKFLAGGGGVSSFSDGTRMQANTLGGERGASAAPEKVTPLPAAALRSLIISGLASAHPSSSLRESTSSSSTVGHARSPSFDSIVSGYAFSSTRSSQGAAARAPPGVAMDSVTRKSTQSSPVDAYFRGLL